FQNNGGRIRYTYDALGVKVRKEVDDVNGTTTTDYLDGFQYKNDALQFFPTAEGYVEFKEPGRLFYVYNYTDHLGNVRMSYTDNGVAVPKILEENHYYPFGLKHENYASEIFERIKETNGELFVIQPTERREWQYKYNGKEWQDELGLNFYDYGARNYDAAIGRWMNVDNMAEKYYEWSPFNYAINNPVNVIDPDGNDIYLLIWFSKNGETGHAGIAIDNYKTVVKKDKDGNTIYDKDGKALTEQVKDGTYTYYDLWPNEAVGDTELQDNVEADYTKGIKINSLKDLMSKDPTQYRSGNVSAEGRSADGIVKIPTTYSQDVTAKQVASRDIKNDKSYNGCYNNCSTYAQRIINSAYPSLNASQTIKPSGILRTIYDDAKTVAPNNLYNAALKIKGAANVKGPSSVVAKPYLEYFGKSNRQ
uniref:RHS repeat domain-containing protein n=1 Tax=Flavobacterium sp. TaxID=239 RepID=UPI002616A91C